MSVHKEITPEQIARIKLRYEARMAPVHDIAREEGVTPSRIYELRRRFGWRTRTDLGKELVERSIEQEREIARALLETAAETPDFENLGRDDAGAVPAQPADRPALLKGRIDAVALALRVQEALDRELTDAQARLADQSVAGADIRIRALTSMARALTMLKPIIEARDKAAHDEEPPLDLAELRRELMRRLARMREESEQNEAAEGEPRT